MGAISSALEWVSKAALLDLAAGKGTWAVKVSVNAHTKVP
jgi:hypothetical protein